MHNHKTNKKRTLDIKNTGYTLSGVLLISLVLSGTFFDYAVFFLGATLSLVLFLMHLYKIPIFSSDKRLVFYLPTICLFAVIISSVWATDSVLNLLGAVRILVLLLFMWLYRSNKEANRLLFKQCIPIFAGIMIIISLLFALFPSLSGLFWENNRLSGFFQYANTCALFISIGIIILSIYPTIIRPRFLLIALLFILIVGLLFTGSRIVLIFTIMWSIYNAIKNKNQRKITTIIIISIALMAICFVLLTKNTQNIGRIFTVFSSNSTLWGRILYMKDAISIIIKHPLGIGRLGYSYRQGLFQTGVYHVRYVHNSLLQIIIDYGIFVFALLSVFIIWQFAKGKQSSADKELLLFILINAFTDFHFEYLCILIITTSCFDYGNVKKETSSSIKENFIFLPISFVFCIYLTIATACSSFGRADLCLSMFPMYSPAKEHLMNSMPNSKNAFLLANSILNSNPYNHSAYVVRGAIYANENKVKECIEDLDMMIKLDPYNIVNYRNYSSLLEDVKSQIISKDPSSTDIIILQERIDSLPEELLSLQEKTSSLAYKIKDTPSFSY